MDLFDLVAKLRLDKSDYTKGLKDAEGEAGGLGSKLASGLGTAVKVTGAAIMAGAGAVVTLTKQATDAYANYQQLSGGVQKLFGDASDKMMEYASNAYKTSGMSANQYMEQATSFSAALINSLDGDTAKAADQADKAMRAISDNFNTFGGDISNVQNAFQGFAKQNYTMLDNLKLGYGGTKTEMERLIADANEYAKSIGQAGDLSIDSFSDIVDAIDLIQQKQNIAGTTSKEAASTIEGSFLATKAAWENLVSGFANPDADLGKLFSDLSTTAEAAFKNMMPAIEQALSGIATLVERVAPMVAEKLPGLVDSILPPLLDAASTIVGSLVSALPSILSALTGVAPKVVSVIIDGLVELLPAFPEIAIQLVTALAQGLADSTPKIVERLPEIINGMIDGFVSHMPELITAGVQLVSALIIGLIQSIPAIIDAIPQLIDAITTSFKGFDWASLGRQVIDGLKEGISKGFSKVVGSVKNLASKMLSTFKSVFGIHSPSTVMQQAGEDIGTGLQNGMRDIPSKASQLFSNMKTGVTNLLSRLKGDSGNQAVQMTRQMVAQMQSMATQSIAKAQAMASQVGNHMRNMATNLGNSARQMMTNVVNQMQAMATQGQQKMQAMASNIRSVASQIPNQLKGAIQGAVGAVSSWGQSLVNTARSGVQNMVKSAVGAAGGLAGQFRNIGINLVSGLRNGIGGAISGLYNSIYNSMKGLVKRAKNALGIHSPSKEFAKIGAFSAAGLGEGWDKSIQDVKDRIIGDMDFSSVNAEVGEITPNGVSSQNSQLLEVLAQYLPRILDKVGNDIYIDRTKVGSIMDKELGRRRTMAGRANA